MSVSVPMRKCQACHHLKVVGVEIPRVEKRCRKCRKEGKPVTVSPRNGEVKKQASEKPHPADFKICEARLYDGFYHVHRIGMMHTVCKRQVRPVPDSFPQGVVALETLYGDVGACCLKCRKLLERMFD